MTLDTHNDISPNNFTAECNYTMDLGNQVNLPKMIKGGLDASFFIVYVGQDTGRRFTPAGYERAYKQAIEKFDAIHRLTEQIAPDKIGLALTAADARRIYASGKKVAFIGVENGYPIGEDLGRIKEFYDRGARYMSLAHNGHSQLSDSNTGERDGWKWNGLSPLGKQAIAEMNRLGIMIDVSHPSKESMMQTLAADEGADHRVALGRARALRRQPQHGRRAAAGAEEERRRHADRSAFAQLREDADSPPSATAALDALRKEFNLPAGRRSAAGRGAVAARRARGLPVGGDGGRPTDGQAARGAIRRTDAARGR